MFYQRGRGEAPAEKVDLLISCCSFKSQERKGSSSNFKKKQKNLAEFNFEASQMCHKRDIWIGQNLPKKGKLQVWTTSWLLKIICDIENFSIR